MKKYLVYNNRLSFCFYVIFQVIQILLSIGVAILLNWILDQISLSLKNGNQDVLIKDFIVCVIYALIYGLFTILSGRFKASCIRNASLHLREDLMYGLLAKSSYEFNNKETSSYISLLNQNVSMVEENYFKNKLSIYENIVSIVFAVILLIFMNPLIAAVSIGLMSIPSFIPKLFSKKLAKLQSEIGAKGVKYNSILNDLLHGFCIIKDYNVEDKMRKRYECQTVSFENSKFNFIKEMSKVFAVSGATGVVVQFFVIVFAGILAVRGYLTIGSIVAVTQLTGQVISPTFQLSAKKTQLKSIKDILLEMEEIISVSDSNKDNNKHILNIENFEKIELKDISYSFDESKKIFKNVDFKFEKGKHYAIIGKSGCGKSTLLKIVSGYYKPTDGSVLINGEKGIMIPYATVSQEVFIFAATLRDNVTLFNDFKEEEILMAIEKSGLTELVNNLPNGLDTQINENGSSLSGGERQRIAIARALIFNRSLLLFDEATSALDEQTAIQIEKTIHSLPDKTVLSVTHRTDEKILGLYDEVINL